MDIITKNLAIIEHCIQNKGYEEVETERFELKDLSQGWGEDWYKSVCAFLNTNGGIIVIGIQDKNNSKPPYYKFTGYNNSDANEKHLKQELPKKFTDEKGNKIDLTHHITNCELRDFEGGRVVVVYIEELSAEKKYIYYEGKAYIRKLTGDHELSRTEIEIYEEVKKDVISYQELKPIQGTSINDLNLNVLNQFIFQANIGKKRGETKKETLAEAAAFLVGQGFLYENKVTMLGMLVCGDYPERWIQGKCEIDCYVEVPNSHKVAQSKEIIEDNIIELIRRSQSFIWRNIEVGVLYTNGGMAAPEYPEALIREMVNNAVAHRSYINERFIIIEIHPQKCLLIRNPGMFQQRQRIYLNTEFGQIRRIVPIQAVRNPKLAQMLKNFDYWEGKGKGLTSLIDACLDNEIDVPYYILTADEIHLYIPKGKVYDEQMELWWESFEGYFFQKIGRDLTEEEKIILSFFKKSEELNVRERYTILMTMSNNHHHVIDIFMKNGLLFNNPESPALYPIYQVDRKLMKIDFWAELKQLFGQEWEALNFDYKTVLNVIYLQNHFGKMDKAVSINRISAFLYVREPKRTNKLGEYESYKRKIRNVISHLAEKQMIVRKNGKADFGVNAP